MITGVRGAGKTVALTSIANELRKKKNWIVGNAVRKVQRREAVW